MDMPHEILTQWVRGRIDYGGMRRNYFRGMEFAAPVGDPGWFGPARCGMCIRTWRR